MSNALPLSLKIESDLEVKLFIKNTLFKASFMEVLRPRNDLWAAQKMITPRHEIETLLAVLPLLSSRFYLFIIIPIRRCRRLISFLFIPVFFHRERYGE